MARLAVILLPLIVGLISVALTYMVRLYALRTGVLDRPNARSSHTAPTPRGGGLAVVVATLLGLVAAVALQLTTARDAVTLGSGMVAVGAVGWLDDRRPIPPLFRLAVHVGAAVWTVSMLGGLPTIQLGTTFLLLGAVGYVVGAIGIVWSINLFNFMDGIDGLAGSQAVMAFGVGALLLFWRGNQSLGTLSAIAAAATAGFLMWNWPPARIFLGDVGSGAIGYLLAAIALASENDHSVPLLVFVILSALFIADATVTLVRRLRRGEKPAEAHRDHAYQRLTRRFGSHRTVSISAIAAMLVLSALGAAAVMHPSALIPALCAAGLFVAALLVVTEYIAPMRDRVRS